MVKMLIWVVIGLLALSFFGISLRALYESPTNQDNLSFILTLTSDGWDHISGFFEGVPDFFKDISHLNIPTYGK